MWRILRVGLLSLLLVVVGSRFVLDRYYSRAWNSTLWVAIYPIDADGTAVTQRYVAALRPQQFTDIESFFAREARRHGIGLPTPLHVQLMPPVTQLPPRLPEGASALRTALWSLRMRWYSWRHGAGSISRVRIFVLYHDPLRTSVVPHSLGLQKGLVGVVYGFADAAMSGANSIVIAHEVLHTLGATDHYNLATGQPLYPQGFAEPALNPRFPQHLAEIMAGRVPLTANSAEMPESLTAVVIGDVTAEEINWGHP